MNNEESIDGINQTQPTDTHLEVSTGATILLDVRTPEEREQWHIPGTKSIVLSDLSEQELKKAGIEKGNRVIVHCIFHRFGN